MTTVVRNGLCRLCGADDGVNISLVESQYSTYILKINKLLCISVKAYTFLVKEDKSLQLKFLSYLANFKIKPEDQLPKVLCHRCVIKVDDFQSFFEKAHATQENLLKTFAINLEQSHDFISNTTVINISEVGAPSNQNQLNSCFTSSTISHQEDATLNPPEIIQLNLVTVGPPEKSSEPFSGNFSKPFPDHRNSCEVINPNNDSERPITSRPLSFRGGSRPFPRKIHETLPLNFEKNNETPPKNPHSFPQSEVMESDNISSSSRSSPESSSESQNNMSNFTPVSNEKEKKEEKNTFEESDSKKSDPSSVSSSENGKIKIKRKKYQSPFCVPSRRKKRLYQKPVSPQEKKSNISEGKLKTLTRPEITSIPEEDLSKYFIFTKVPNVGIIYTCKNCEAIFTSAKAASSHTNCVGSLQDNDSNDYSSSSEESTSTNADSSRSETAEKEPIYTCQFCDKPFTRNVVRLQHEQLHLKELRVSGDEDDVLVPKKLKKTSLCNKSLVNQFILR